MPACWRVVSNADPLPSTSPIRLSTSADRSPRCRSWSGFAESQAGIGPTRMGMPSTTGYSRRQAALEQTTIPSMRSSPRSTSARATASGARASQTTQSGRKVSKWSRRTHPPMMTVGQPGGRILPVGPGIGATQETCAVMSLTRAAGRLPISTVNEPRATMPGPAGTQPGSVQGVVVSVERAAGWLPTSTVNSPVMSVSGRAGWAEGLGTGAGGWMGAWQCGASCRTMSPRRAAGPLMSRVYSVFMDFEQRDDAGKVVQRGALADGELDGELVQLDGDGGVLAKMSYRKGKLDGESLFYDGGTLKLRSRYRDGLQDGENILYGDGGRPVMAASYRAGKLHGTSSWFRPDGSLERTANYVDGTQEGEAAAYDAQGRVIERATYRGGKLDGELRRYTKSGKVRETIVYRDGKPQ